MLSIVCFKWQATSPEFNSRNRNTAKHVNNLRRMVARHYRGEHRFICITDKSDGIDKEVEVVPLWDDFAAMKSPYGPRYPSCYRRLKLFSRGIEAIVGKRFVWMDLDVVIVREVTPLWDRDGDIVLLRGTNPSTHYNGSMLLMTAGARSQVWDDFDPDHSPASAKAAAQFGSDQGWISYKLGPNEKRWTVDDGVYCYRRHIYPRRPLPENARIVFFNGKNDDPADPLCQQHRWVRANWC